MTDIMIAIGLVQFKHWLLSLGEYYNEALKDYNGREMNCLRDKPLTMMKTYKNLDF